MGFLEFCFPDWGASTVKYTTLVPCIGLSENDLKLYTNFECCEGKFHKHLKITLIYKAKQFMLTIKIQEKSTYFIRWCKWVY